MERSFHSTAEYILPGVCAQGTCLRPIHTGSESVTRSSALANGGMARFPPGDRRHQAKIAKFTWPGKDLRSRSLQLVRVPLDPTPDWVLTRRRAIGIRIRDAREHVGLSQVELAEHIGRDHKTIHRFEYGTSVPTLVDLLLIAHATDSPLSHLVAD